MKNVDETFAALSYVFDGLKDGSIKPNVATEMNNSCGKIINLVKVQLEYYALIKETPNIKFLEVGEPPAISSDNVRKLG